MNNPIHGIATYHATTTLCGLNRNGLMLGQTRYAWRLVTCKECLSPTQKPLDVRSTWTIENNIVKGAK